MNLLDILSAGKRDLNEENVSSFVAWLLDPGQSHGCGSLFLKHLLQVMNAEKFKPWITGLVSKVAYRKLSPIKIDVMVEETVETATNKRRDVDIIVILSNGTDVHVLAIENKIREEACDITQLAEEYEGLSSVYAGAEISFLYLTPSKSNKFIEAFKQLPEKIIKLHLGWTKVASNPNDVTFVDILRTLLRYDSEAKIDPLSHEVRFVLKSFILFAENGFRSQANKESPVMSNNGTKYFKGIVAGLEGLRELFQEQQGVYVGYIGGISALKKAALSQLENRPFKWDDSPSGAGKKASNWIPIAKFKEILEHKGWWIP